MASRAGRTFKRSDAAGPQLMFTRRPGRVFMFSGQGSQHYHMARELFAQEAVFRARLLELDEIVRKLSGLSVVEHIYDDRHRAGDAFEELLLTHPAVVMVELALAHTLVTSGIEPDATVGVSLGSYAA